MSYDADHAARLKDIKRLGKYLNDTVNANNAYAHNAIYRGKNIGAVNADMLANIANGTFKDIYPGDTGTIGNYTFTVAGCNPWHTIIDIRNHLAIILTNCGSGYWSTEEQPYADGLLGAYIYATALQEILANCETVVGADHIRTLGMPVADSYSGFPLSGGNYDHYTNAEMKILLPSAAMVTGFFMQNLSGFPNITNNDAIGYTAYPYIKSQLPLFRYCHIFRVAGMCWSDMPVAGYNSYDMIWPDHVNAPFKYAPIICLQ